MGITGLLPFLKSIHRPCHVKSFKDQTLGVDGYVWLHRGVYSCAQELCLGQPTTKYVNYAIKQVRLLRHWGIEPFIVFDGGPLPSKRGTEQGRKKSREEGRELANRLLAEGKTDEAREAFQKAVDVTPEMAYQLIKALTLEKVRYLVAPYEADAQLRYLELHSHIDGILTEDSDLLVFGAKNVVFKLDKDGMCVHVCREDFGKVPDSGMAFWTDREFRQMAILSGCDYLDSISGVALKTAHGLIRKHKTAEKAIRAIGISNAKLCIPRNYLRSFRIAEHTFLHQTVYDPVSRSLVPLHPLPPIGDKARPSDVDLSGCGELFGDDEARGVAEGKLCPVTKEPIRDLVPEANRAASTVVKAGGSAKKKPASQGKKVKTEPLPRNQQTLANFFTKRPSTPTQQASTRKGSSRDVLSEVRNVNSPSPPRKSSKFFGASAVSSKPVSTTDVKGKGKASDSPFDLQAIELRAEAKDEEEEEYWRGLEEVQVEDAEPLDEEGWRQATQEWQQEEDDYKSQLALDDLDATNGDVGIVDAVGEQAYGGEEEEAPVVWEDSGNWDEDLPSSQMQAGLAMATPGFGDDDDGLADDEQGDGHGMQGWKDEEEEQDGRFSVEPTQFRDEGRISTSPDLLSSPARDHGHGHAALAFTAAPEPDLDLDLDFVPLPRQTNLKRTADQSFDSPHSSDSSLPSGDEIFDSPSKRFKGGDSSFESFEAEVSVEAEVGVKAPIPFTLVEGSSSPSLPPQVHVKPADLPTPFSPLSDPIDDASSDAHFDEPSVSSFASSGSRAVKGFAPSPRKRLSSSSGRKAVGGTEEASPALLKLGQNLRDRFMAPPVGKGPGGSSRQWGAARGHDSERKPFATQETAAAKLAAAARPLSRKASYHPTSLSTRGSTSKAKLKVGTSILAEAQEDVMLPQDVEVKNPRLLAFKFSK